ncbi:chemotaxis protein CheB [Variovorax ginsengisoli]|uniref:protein-glutamate methylesterase n=1 Tax=Variovorax ginsengisoli TaxID=363844 RepID=A0ABT9S9L1_9BURK|nr:chemotaxis protein CheB [Variovorax ginsengisoli]MDP9900062.1 two-component system chemotaxis response regulator CheB [Variovorax ginsengisoli]
MTTASALSLLRGVDAVVIGASAGGIDALLVLLDDLPARWRLPLVVVIHLPEAHESRLAEVFRQRMRVPVCEAQDKAQVAAGTLHFAPPGYHLSIERGGVFSLSCEPPVRWSRPSIDVLMTSAADAYGARLAGMILTGANDDGAEGLMQIHRAGGLTAVQSPEEAQVDTMPRAAMTRHIPTHVLPLRALHTLLLQLDNLHAH